MSAALGNLSKLNCARLHDISVLFTSLLVYSFTKIVLKSAISRQAKANKFSLVFWLNEIVHINAPFLDIFGCARHSPNKFGSALACTKIGGGSA